MHQKCLRNLDSVSYTHLDVYKRQQVEDPKQAKGIVKRDVIRVVTPGTVLDNTVLDETKNNYILCIYGDKNGYGLSVCDVTTGEFKTTEFVSVNAANKIIDEIALFSPAEIICNESFKNIDKASEIEKRFNKKISVCDSWMFRCV